MTAAELPVRHPMGLPRGSVRALLTFLVLGLVIARLLMPETAVGDNHVPLYLFYLLFLILVHYFAARSHAPDPVGRKERHPLFLPRGTVRVLIFLALLGAVGFGIYRNPEFLSRLVPSGEAVQKQPYLPIVILGSYLAGILVNRLASLVLAGPQGLPPWYQDLQASLALIAVLLLCVEAVLLTVVFPSVAEDKRIDWPMWQSILSGVVAFYFGARS